jgi:CheY-like chemotaxis protein/HPt (histidine-containing phosphotransfer) domain-containing protein
MANLLLDTDLDEEQRSFANTIRDSAETLLTIINDILDFSKMEADKLELEQQPFDLRDCVEGAVDLVSILAANKGIDLAYVIEPDTPAAVVGDPTRLRQVLLNLLNNAIKFTERGEVVLTVSAAAPRPPAGPIPVLFEVRDTGIGIPKEKMDRLFQPFSQVDTSTTRRFGGTGLGLVISQRLVQLMGGTIEAESVEGQGTRVRFTVNLPPTDELKTVDWNAVHPALTGKRILIVDDNETNRRILALQAQSWSMEPVVESRPPDALARIRAGEPFDCAVIDMVMPEMDGLSLANEIRRVPGGERLPLILLSSLMRPGSGRSQELARAAFSCVLTKPIKPSPLLNAVMGAVSGRPMQVVGKRAATESRFDREMAERMPLRILLADDHPTNQKLGLMMLARLGYQADLAGNGREVLSALERQHYDVVLMDIEMPEMDGVEATARIRERFDREGGPRVIAMTANAMHGDRERFLSAGMDDYISKPIRLADLIAALEAASSNRRLIAEEGSPQSGEGTKSPALDPAALDKLREAIGGDPAALSELIDSFLAEGPKLVDGLKAAADRGDCATLRRVAHTLKSVARDFGAAALAEVAAELEGKANSGAVSGVAELVAAAEDRYRAAHEALRTARENAPHSREAAPG